MMHNGPLRSPSSILKAPLQILSLSPANKKWNWCSCLRNWIRQELVVVCFRVISLEGGKSWMTRFLWDWKTGRNIAGNCLSMCYYIATHGCMHCRFIASYILEHISGCCYACDITRRLYMVYISETIPISQNKKKPQW